MRLPTDTCVLVGDYGIGDHYIVGGFAEAVSKKYGLKVWMAGRAQMAWVADLYPAVERFLPLPDHLKHDELETTKPTGGEIFYAHFPQLELAKAIGFKDFHFLDAYRVRLGLPEDSELSKALLPSDEELAHADELLRRSNLPAKKTVLLNIDAKSISTETFSADYWTAMADALSANGLHPLINRGPETIVPPGLPSMDIPIRDYRALALAAGAVCTVRSGISDLVSDLPCARVVLYPKLDYEGGPLLKGTSFEKFGAHREQREFLVSPDCRTESIAQTVEYLAANPNVSAAA